MGMNRELVGYEGKPVEFVVEADQVRAYAAAVNEDNPLFLGKNPVAPPCFTFTVGLPAMGKCMFHPKLGANIMRLVHGEHVFRYRRPVKAGERLVSRGKILSIEEKPTGETVTILVTSEDSEGKEVSQSEALFFIRGSGSGKSAPAEPVPEPAKFDFEVPMKVAPDQATRFGNASGDKNPIHMNNDAARASGLPGVILHGLCTLSFAAQAVVDSCMRGEAPRLAEFGARFSKMVLPGDTVTTRIRKTGAGVCEFDVVNQNGITVISRGYARWRE